MDTSPAQERAQQLCRSNRQLVEKYQGEAEQTCAPPPQQLQMGDNSGGLCQNNLRNNDRAHESDTRRENKTKHTLFQLSFLPFLSSSVSSQDQFRFANKTKITHHSGHSTLLQTTSGRQSQPAHLRTHAAAQPPPGHTRLLA